MCSVFVFLNFFSDTKISDWDFCQQILKIKPLRLESGPKKPNRDILRHRLSELWSDM